MLAAVLVQFKATEVLYGGAAGGGTAARSRRWWWRLPTISGP
jgi:hypothetical protein